MSLKKEFFGFYVFALILPLPLPLIFSSIAMGLLIVNCLVILSRKRLGLNLISVIFLLFFFADSIALILSGKSFEGNTIFNDVKISCLVLPIAFYNLREDLTKETSSILKLFILGVIIYILYYYYFI